jgi:hypothetical protein
MQKVALSRLELPKKQYQISQDSLPAKATRGLGSATFGNTAVADSAFLGKRHFDPDGSEPPSRQDLSLEHEHADSNLRAGISHRARFTDSGRRCSLARQLVRHADNTSAAVTDGSEGREITYS